MEMSVLLKDLEFGSAERKMDAIGKLRLARNVDFAVVRPLLERALKESRNDSPLKFYAACALAACGDGSDVVVDSLSSFLQVERGEPRDDPFRHFKQDYYNEDGATFPWAGEFGTLFHTSTSPLKKWRASYPAPMSLETLSQIRGNERVANGIKVFLTSSNSCWRLFGIYAAGGNGYPSLREPLEYLRDREPGTVDAEAARIALEHFGTSTFLDIALMHGRLQPPKKEAKSGCFIATAVYGSQEDPSVIILRNFRDQALLSTRFGTACASLYYWISPPLADLISRSESAKATVRRLILQPSIWCIKRFVRPKSMTNRR
jgi:hypothetical protein